ncbi:aminotransferase class I/II-fold pyridoxal phosphate-dependent enzyme [Crenobacter sp. SG2303]|uniref:Aminotransferase class I/II-fold pyridoxal phosphate-dependent enzyme n=1 Tax=Crenobacter oryzisoli TaxID=3056844 RepID=A0ABT7XT50_9NEIS|nr:aminotransferase class I/II-fold pyridoxal phosphate-dependent enzyme [Crenobacter sp. SG2303]MDN0076976.1 aminotransferase class I/II-fold pyridoxal phosphate-dependent enzyme [Crenobacter sp. SG2303]
MVPISRVVVVSDDAAWQSDVLEGLDEAASRLPNSLGMVFVGANSAEATMTLIARDGEIQIVLIDNRLSEEQGAAAAVALANRINAFRPELSLYVMLVDADEKAVIEALASHAVDGYFYRDELDSHGWFRILAAELAEKSATPFYDALKHYVNMAKDSWHTPGHAGGDSLKASPWVGDFYEFVGENMLRADLSVSVPMLDSLLHPTGVIADAQALAAKAFGAQQTFFATNGTSTANKVICQTLLTPGDTVLLDRNCHKSVHHGVILSGARPIYLDSSVNRRYGLFGPVAKAKLFDAIDRHPEARVLILTSCTYDGLRYDLVPIVEHAHLHNIKVVVDEAWYGFARFHPAFRPTALESGADYVTQSTHKILSAFSQASMVHVNDPAFDAHLFRENFNMHTSTSPQYGLIASLDVARKQAAMEGYRLLDRTLKLAEELRDKINATGAFRVLELTDLLSEEVREDGIQLDPTKLTVDISASGFSADELQRELFEHFNIQVEKSTFSTLTLLLTLGTTRSKVSRLHDAMLRLAKQQRPPRQPGRLPEIPHFTQLACLPRDAFYEAGESLPLLDDEGRPNPALLGRVSCDQIVPYPPGIPVLVPGQIIDDAIITYLHRLLKAQKGVDIHGLIEKDAEYLLRVLRDEELATLPARHFGD